MCASRVYNGVHSVLVSKSRVGLVSLSFMWSIHALVVPGLLHVVAIATHLIKDI